MPEISIIVPCFNSEKYIKRCLDSLLNQTLKDIDIIVVDDGSTDSTSNIVKSYSDNRIRYFIKENEGIAEARNFGVSKVNSEYFGFLDSDDYCEPETFETLLNKIKKDNSDLAICNFIWEFEGESSKNYIEHEGPYNLGKEMMLGLFATLWNKVYKTSFIKSLDYNFIKGYRYEDASVLYKMCSYVKKISFIDKPYFHYTQRKGSITRTYNEKVKDMVFIFNDLYDYYNNHNLLDEYKNELEYVFIRFFLGNSFLRSAKIKDKEDKENTLNMSWNILNEKFPNWKNNKYINKSKSIRNLYYKIISKNNYYLIARLYSFFNKKW